MTTFIQVLISALVIAFASWLSGRNPSLAGFIICLPLASMLVLPMSHVQHDDSRATMEMARSIFIALPVSLGFFVPFLFAERLGTSFWQTYGLGCAALPVAYTVHRLVSRMLA